MISDDEAVRLLIRGVVAQARRLPCREAADSLRGLLVLGGDHPALDEVRAIYVTLNQCESQLELLASQ